MREVCAGAPEGAVRLGRKWIGCKRRFASASDCLAPTSLRCFPRRPAKGFPPEARRSWREVSTASPFEPLSSRTAREATRLGVDQALRQAVGAEAGDTITVEITRAGEEPEIRVPLELHRALEASPRARELWAAITPSARRDWILWIVSARQGDTRQRRIEKACDMLASGKRRVCCFGGLRWLMKDHPTVETWHRT